MEEDKELQWKVRDNFIVSLAAYIKVGNTEQFVNDLSTITNFFSRLPKDNKEIYSILVNSTNEYNIITQKVDELINNLNKISKKSQKSLAHG